MTATPSDAAAPAAPAASPAEVARARIVDRWMLAAHCVLAAFVTLRGYPATQDGPAHLYGAHLLRELARDPSSQYAAVFASNLHPGSNTLFFYASLWSDGLVSVEGMASIALFVAIAGLPISAAALAAALRAQAPAQVARAHVRSLVLQAPEGGGAPLPRVAATCLAYALAYNYFIYRGFFNYTLSVPLAIGCLAAVVAAGGARRAVTLAGLAIGAVTLATLASLAHPSASVFLLAAIPMASLRGGAARRWIAGAALVPLALFLWLSQVSMDRPPPTEWSSPASSVMRFVRALGVTHGWIELLPALLLLAMIGWGAARALRPVRALLPEWQARWPAALAVAMAAGFFVVPFAYGGVAGLNERIPLFVALLLLPYVPLEGRLLRWAPAALALFALYTGVGSVLRERRVDEVRASAAAAALPRGALVYPVSLDIKLGSLSADLGRHLVADVARRQGAVTGRTFCTHPGHPVRCTTPATATHDEGPAERFAHLSADDRRRALQDFASPIRAMFREIAALARRADYLAVIAWPPLDEAFREHVLQVIGAEPIGDTGGRLRLYRVPPAARGAERTGGDPAGRRGALGEETP